MTTLIFSFVFSFANSLAQDNLNPTVPPYGGKWVTTDAGIGKRGKITWLIFDAPVYYNQAKFVDDAWFANARFPKDAWFLNTHFLGNAWFGFADFRGLTQFTADFARIAQFGTAHFSDYTYFAGCTFDSSAYFGSARFDKGVDFVNTVFKKQLELDGTIIKSELDLVDTQFLEGVDFRRADLDSLNIIYVNHRTFFPDGKLWARWDQLRGRFQLRLSHFDSSALYLSPDSTKTNLSMEQADSVRNDLYRSLEMFYERLRDNFIAQRDNESADNAMYELGKQRSEMLNEFDWKIYGWLFGWGYQPWRFLVFVVLPFILTFTLIWYWLYFELAIRMIDDKVEQEFSTNPSKLSFRTREISLLPSWRVFRRAGRLKICTHSDSGIGLGRLSRYWHVLFFSASVLLDIRFKKQWLQKIETKGRLGERSFLAMITIEWALGIGLYIAFAILVKGSRFEFIKGLLGF
jgi:uncharacterized protein YjbI with pentapeptide repeats